jgi:hypothetical protein
LNLACPAPPKPRRPGLTGFHEIEHDGFRIIARRDGKKVRLISRHGKDLTYRFPLAAQAIAELSVNSCVIDGEAIVCDATGLAVFNLIRSYRNGPRATLCAFDIIEINGEDLRWRLIEDRKSILKKLIGNIHPGIAFNKHFDIEGSVLFHHACKLGCEGIVSKRIGSLYRFGRSSDWIKVKNPAAPAVNGEAEEDWRTNGQTIAMRPHWTIVVRDADRFAFAYCHRLMNRTGDIIALVVTGLGCAILGWAVVHIAAQFERQRAVHVLEKYGHSKASGSGGGCR